MSSVFRANQCARLTCKSCSCFKRVCDSLSENLRLSTAFQQLLDAMSDDDSSLSGDSDVESSDSDTIFSDFEDHFVQFELYKLCYCYQFGKYIFLNKEAGRLSWTKICNNFYRQQTMAEQGHTRSLSSKQDQMKVLVK